MQTDHQLLLFTIHLGLSREPVDLTDYGGISTAGDVNDNVVF